MNKKGILTIVSGFAGSGKGTIMKGLVEKYSYGLSVSATTRQPRQGEIHGREYFFLTREEFESKIKNNLLIEWAEYVGNYYGTPKEYVQQQLAQGQDVILEIEIQGALKVKQQFPNAVLIFVTPPSVQVLRERLIGRGTETLEVVQQRMKRAAEEAEYMERYDYVIENIDIETSIENVHHIIAGEHCKVLHNNCLIDSLKKDFEVQTEGDR